MLHKIRSGGVYTMRAKQSGFTLVEALIAFLIVAVGLAGAALFQSKLITESGTSKSTSVAVKLAEKKLEDKRTAFLEGDYTALDILVAASSTEITSTAVGNTEYTVKFTPSSTTVSTASMATDAYYQFTVAVEWEDARGKDASVALSTFLSSNDPAKSLDDSEDAGTGANENIGKIVRPSGSAIAIARDTVYKAHDDSVAIGDIVSIEDTVSGGYGIKVGESDDGKDIIVSVIQLISGTDFFRISGDIYFDASATVDFASVSAAPNVLTSEGGGCTVYEYGSTVSQAAYTCAFGSGWYGTIALLLSKDGDNKLGSTCLSPRSYKYYIVEPTTSSAGAIVDGAIVGQSGLVRFTDEDGSGPYIATSQANPGLGYYYMYDQVVSNVASTASTAGDVLNQHFVVTGDDITKAEEVIDYCITGGGKYGTPTLEPIDSGADYSVDYPDLSQASHVYAAASDAVIPDSTIILGYVKQSYEIAGDIIISGVSEAASALKDRLSVKTVVSPAFAPACALSVKSDGSALEYSCYVDYNWTGSVEMIDDDSVLSGIVSGTPSITKYVFMDNPVSTAVEQFDPVTENISGKDFIVTE